MTIATAEISAGSDTKTVATSGGVGVSFEQLSKRYGDFYAVDSLDLNVAPGEFLSILGPSGSGKTTVLMLIAGFVSPSSGRLVLGGQDISQIPPFKRNIGVVFQNYALFPHLDVRRNIAFPLEVRGCPSTRSRGEWIGRLNGFTWASLRLAVSHSFPVDSSSALRSRGQSCLNLAPC